MNFHSFKRQTRNRKCRNYVTLLLGILLTLSSYLRYRLVLESLDVTESSDAKSTGNELHVPAINKSTHTTTSETVGMEERARRMHQICSQYPKRRQQQAVLNSRVFYISQKYNLSYCKVAKVGSTFWTQVFMTLQGIERKNGKSVFDLGRDQSHETMKTFKGLTVDIFDNSLKDTTSFLVARNPYSRLFSAYIDQIYLPNKWFSAKYMIFGQGQKERMRCGSDVTFDEFLKAVTGYMIRKLPNDLHWAPIFSICSPCQVKIDLLAKQETFNEDAEYILNVTNIPRSIREDVKRVLKENYTEHSLSTLVHTYVTKAHEPLMITKGCISEEQLAERIWTAFQIQGHIHNDIPFPADKFQSSSKKETEKQLSKLVSEAVEKRHLTSKERNIQRHNWQVHFYKQIPAFTLEKVRDAYYEDFLVFQYDFNPENM